MAKKIIKGVKKAVKGVGKVAGLAGGILGSPIAGVAAAGLLGSKLLSKKKKAAPEADGAINPMLSPVENATDDNRALMRKRRMSGGLSNTRSNSILSDTLG